ncbi:DcuS/MalK family sensor histidine kinase [Peribacillus kribbensis]|uniref:DcuS/MalK family sensor histidine kinase n=1 Tax=Peribacillus kribbensis TaxID=356658 RepID=UPI00047AA50E|nr:DcuS/MalK family sensor histidine kinase [Peribacillus kribbensis]
MHRKRFRLRLQTRIILLVCSVVAISLIATDLLISEKVGSTAKHNLQEKAMDIARVTAHSPPVVEALQRPGDSNTLPSYTNEMARLSNVEFIVVMDMKGIRLSHPDAENIGRRFVGGDEGPVLHGREHVSTAKGTLGYSLRAFTPVYSKEGRQIGAVAVGISLEKVNQDIRSSKKAIYVSVLIGIGAGVAGAVFLARKIKKSTFGLEPIEIGKLLEERSAMLQSTKEGILAIDQEARITLINNEAMRLFGEAGFRDHLIGCLADDYFPQLQLKSVLESGIPRIDEEIHLSGVTLLVNQLPVFVGGEAAGAIATFRTRSEIHRLAEELTGVKLYAEALRARTHEFMNKLHVILGLVQLGQYEKLAQYISQVSTSLDSETGYISGKIKDPALAGFILGKMSYARESGTDMSFTLNGVFPEEASDASHEYVTILGNLIDNALESMAGQENRQLSVHIEYDEHHLYFEITDNGPGMDQDTIHRIFEKGFSTKGINRGIGLHLVKSTLNELQGHAEVLSEPGNGTTFILTIPYPRARPIIKR